MNLLCFILPHDLYKCKNDFNIPSCITIFHPRNFCPKTSNKSYFFLNDDRILGILMANINRRCVKKESANKSSLHEIHWWYIYDVLINKCITNTMRSRLDVLLFISKTWFIAILSLFIVPYFYIICKRIYCDVMP